jgi:putative alpha-1,2-mannosidase
MSSRIISVTTQVSSGRVDIRQILRNELLGCRALLDPANQIVKYAMREHAEVVPPNSDDPIAPDSSTKEGRGALPDWLSLGYITPKFSRAVSWAVEYAGNDFGLYQVASGLGKEDDAQKYLNRSKNWRNHWNAKQESLGFTEFVVPRYGNGSFEEPYDPLQCGGCWEDVFVKGGRMEFVLGAKAVRWANGTLPPSPAS